jgi:hypothetical protein
LTPENCFGERIIQNNTHFQKTQNNIKWSLSGPVLKIKPWASLSLAWAAFALLPVAAGSVAAGSVAAISLSSLSASASVVSGALLGAGWLGAGWPAKVSMTSALDGSATSAGKGSLSAACLCSSFSAGSALLSPVGSSSGSALAGERVCCCEQSALLLARVDLSFRTTWKASEWSGEAAESTLVLFVGAAGLDVLDNNWSCLQGLAKISSSGLMSLSRLIGLALAAGAFSSETKRHSSSSSSSSDSGAFSRRSDLAHEHISWPFMLTKRFANDELDCVNK